MLTWDGRKKMREGNGTEKSTRGCLEVKVRQRGESRSDEEIKGMRLG